jgi:hypothetical protein
MYRKRPNATGPSNANTPHKEMSMKKQFPLVLAGMMMLTPVVAFSQPAGMNDQAPMEKSMTGMPSGEMMNKPMTDMKSDKMMEKADMKSDKMTKNKKGMKPKKKSKTMKKPMTDMPSDKMMHTK